MIKPLFMMHRDAARQADDQRHAQQVARAIDEVVDQIGLSHTTDDADDDPNHQKQDSQFAETTNSAWQCG